MPYCLPRAEMERQPPSVELPTITAAIEVLVEFRRMFRDADYINGYVVFNIRRNRYRLITVIHYAKTTKERQTQGHVYIRSFLTHKEYDDTRNWDRKFGAK